MIGERLVLGTARIAGGASRAEAVALVRSAFDSGICRVDTAPSYGMGTAEAVVGEALFGHPQVEVTTKLGSRRPDMPWLRTFARRIKRLVRPEGAVKPGLPPELASAPGGNDFSPAAMAQSLEISRERLGRIDLLLLHDVTPAQADANLLAELERLAAGTACGYASQAQWNAALDQCFATSMTGQCAPLPDWLLGRSQPPRNRPLRLHSIAKTGLALAAQDRHFATGLDAAAGLIDCSDRLTARIAALYALAAVRAPQVDLLYTSSHRTRLNLLTKVLQWIDNQHAAGTIAACFDTQAG